MRTFELSGLNDFLKDYPSMSIKPSRTANTNLYGKFRFKADVSGVNEIEDVYELEMVIFDKSSCTFPQIKEVGGKIPRTGDFHVNPDGSLCLGSPLRLLEWVYESHNLKCLVDKFLIPYLYAVSCKLKSGGDFLFGELAHGQEGLADDCCAMFGLETLKQGQQVIYLLGMKKRLANKKNCPCGCGKRLGKCSFHFGLNRFRKMAPTSWFKKHLSGKE